MDKLINLSNSNTGFPGTSVFFLALSYMLLFGSCSRPAEPVFEKEFTLNISTQGDGSINEKTLNQADPKSGTAKRVELTATPEEGWGFAGWNGDLQGIQNPTVIALDSDKTVLALFVKENELPEIEIISGPESTIGYNNPEFTWNGNDPDGEVQEYDVELSGPEDQQFTTENEHHQFENLPNGSYTFRLRSIDGEGARSPWASRSFAVDVRSGDNNWPRDTDTKVVDVTNPVTGRTWMDRNLGASRAATSSTDEQAYGDLYQWGRSADGHQKRNSATTNTLSGSDQPGHDDFILSPNSPRDWRSPQNDKLWQGSNGINNPCPVGYRIPTENEWDAEVESWSSNNKDGAFASPLKLLQSSSRSSSNGSLGSSNSLGRYWSSTVVGTHVQRLGFDNGSAGMDSGRRASGYSVRCIKN